MAGPGAAATSTAADTSKAGQTNSQNEAEAGANKYSGPIALLGERKTDEGRIAGPVVFGDDQSSGERQDTAPDQIQIVAYQLWLDRGSPYGTPEEDWFRAEQIFRQRRGIS